LLFGFPRCIFSAVWYTWNIIEILDVFMFAIYSLYIITADSKYNKQLPTEKAQNNAIVEKI
jgi:hypothetical protein